jgi:predicted acyl esterase
MRAGRVVALVCALALAVPAAAEAEITSVFTDTPTPVDCTVQQGGQDDGARFCSESPRSTVAAFDGVPIDVNVAFPPEPESGPDGDYPAVMLFHGYAGSKLGLGSMRRWLQQGYATFSMTTRGFGQSCGTLESRQALGAACDDGYVRLMDTRYEVRDAQELIALLVDEGLVDPERIGATGGSYGGGLSMSLAALNDRKMLPDGSLVDWETPAGTPLSLAAAAPQIPWTDLSYSLVPNGGTLDHLADGSYFAANERVGVPKEAWIETLYIGGFLAGFYAPEGTDPDADLPGWRQRLLQGGGNFDGDPEVLGIVDEISTHHSSYGIDDSVAPAPLMITSGWTDDLFPANEAVRYYNRTRLNHPGTPISLNLADYGHPRGQNKAATVAAINSAENDWFAHWVRADGAAPPERVQALTQTCPNSEPPAGPYFADTYAELAPGEIRFERERAQSIATDGTEHGFTFGSTQGLGGSFATACVTTDAADTEATANYRLDPVPAGGFTMMGSPTVVARFATAGEDSQVAARLLDVAPNGQQTLVARGLWRPMVTGDARVRQVFQLNPNGYRFAEGHVPKLELAPHDFPFGARSAGQGRVSVDRLRLRLPVLESEGALGGVVEAPLPRPLPWGEGRKVRLAPDLDEGPPRTFITKGPKGSTTKRRVTFDWEWSDVGSTLECSLDGAAFESCTGPLEIGGLKTGRHAFEVRAVDPEQNVDETPARRVFKVKR